MTDAAHGGSVEAVIDDSVLLERFDGDTELIREVAQLFLDDCPHRLEAMRAALDSGDAAALQRAAHSLKGSVSNFAADAAADAARQLETLAHDGALSDAVAACAVLEREIARLVPALIRLTHGGDAVGDHAQSHH